MEDILSEFNKFLDISNRVRSVDGEEISIDEQSSGRRVKERGGLKDRLAQTDEQAEAYAALDAVRMQEPHSHPNDISDEELQSIDDEIVMKMFDDFIAKTIMDGD